VPATTLAAGRLGLVVRAGAGYDTIDVPAASARGIYVSNCPGKNSVAVAELTFALLLALDRRIPANAADLQAGRWNKAEYGKARGLFGRTLGLVGLGRIGQEVLARARAFGMPVVAWSRSLTPEHAAALFAGPADASRDTFEFKVAVRNTSAAPLLTQGPQPGYVYQPGQTYLLPELAPTGDVWRVAVGPAGQPPDDLPYRWGLGGTLAPGATTTITGRVRLPPGLASTPLVAVLVHEPARLAHFGVRWGLIAATVELQATVVVDTAQVRSLPSSQASVVAQVGYGSRLAVTSRTPDWVAVSLPDGRRGWVAADWVVLQAT
jgi:hypothetical protein